MWLMFYCGDAAGIRRYSREQSFMASRCARVNFELTVLSPPRDERRQPVKFGGAVTEISGCDASTNTCEPVSAPPLPRTLSKKLLIGAPGGMSTEPWLGALKPPTATALHRAPPSGCDLEDNVKGARLREPISSELSHRRIP